MTYKLQPCLSKPEVTPCLKFLPLLHLHESEAPISPKWAGYNPSSLHWRSCGFACTQLKERVSHTNFFSFEFMLIESLNQSQRVSMLFSSMHSLANCIYFKLLLYIRFAIEFPGTHELHLSSLYLFLSHAHSAHKY